MILIYIGAILASICTIVGCYLVIRIAVRDGIDTSTAADWRIVYMREQNKTASLPQLTSIEGLISTYLRIEIADILTRPQLSVLTLYQVNRHSFALSSIHCNHARTVRARRSVVESDSHMFNALIASAIAFISGILPVCITSWYISWKIRCSNIAPIISKSLCFRSC